VWDSLPFAVAVIVAAFIAGRVAAQSLDALGERIARRRLLFKQISAITRFVVLIGAVVLVSSSLFHFSSEAILALGGSAAVAIGFAFKDVLASLMAGLILLFDRPF
jgi:small-conductance mechanosensitive channel